MKRHAPLLLLLLALGWSSSSAAGDVLCKDATTVEDAFSGEQSVILKTTAFDIVSDEDGQVLHFRVGGQGTSSRELPTGFQILFLLEDKTRITLFSNQPASPSNALWVSEYGATSSVSWPLSLPLSPEAIHALAQSPITHIRYTIDQEKTLDFEGRRWTHWLQRDMACLANKLAEEDRGEGGLVGVEG